jgi:hypothetical protein
MKNCDLCNKAISENEMTVIPRNDFQQAVRGGFNPFTTPGIDMSIITTSLLLTGISSEQYFPRWRQNALNDTTDWGLCQNCARTFRAVSQGSEMDREVQSTTPQKKWFQFWK